MVNTSIYLQSVPLPAVWPLYKHFFSRLFISVWFLLLQRFTFVLALSTSWHLQHLISNKCFKRPEHFLSGFLSKFTPFSLILLILLLHQDITFH